MECGNPMTFAENGRRKFENWNSAAQTTEGLQKDTKSRLAPLNSMSASCVYLPVSPSVLSPCLSWFPTLPACRARHTAARVGCWLVARWTWLAAAAIHMGDKARTANIAVLHECSLMRTRAGSTRDQFHHDISTTCSPVEALRNSSLFQIVHRGLVFLKCCMDTCQ